MSEKAFGIPISSNVHNQLIARKALMVDNDKQIEHNMLMHNRGAFVRVVSSVNTTVPGDDQETNKLAGQFVLQGGVLKSTRAEFLGENDEVTGAKYGFKQKDGLKLLDPNNSSSYTYDDMSGYRPMPGIDALTVTSQGSYGTLKKADISFTAWSLEQLDAIEKLYFRPGFNILVEYGSSAYVNSKTLNVETYQTSLADDFLNKNFTIREFEELIDEKELETSYNYTAFIGRITNFSWSYNADGGFDCSIQIQARGEIVESLNVLMPDTVKSGMDDYITSNPGKDGNFTFLKALKVLKKKGDNIRMLKKYLKDRDGEQLQQDTGEGKGDWFLMRSSGFNVVGLEKEAPANSKYEPGKGYENTFVFINLGGLMALCNSFLMPENENGEKESYFRTNRYESKLSSTFITFPGHVAANPAICMLKENSDDNGYYTDKELYGGTLPSEVKGVEGEIENIYSILLNVDHLINIVEGFAESKVDNSSADTNVFSFLKKTLKDVTTNLGGINEFDLDLDKRVNEWRVIDRNFYDPEKVSGDKYLTLDLVGLGSLVSNFKLETKISGDLTNQLAIAAAVTGDSASMTGIAAYNNGVTDRYKKVLVTGPGEEEPSDEESDDQEKTNEQALEYGGNLLKVYSTYANTKKWDREAFRKIANDHREYTEAAYKFSQKYRRQQKEKAAYKGIIPMDLGFTTDGISGLKVGEAFTIQNNILPTRYHNAVGFLITNITDSIAADNKWETEIGTKMFMLPSTEEPDPSFAAAQEKLAEQKRKQKKKAEKAIASSKRQQAVIDKYGEPGDKDNLVTVVLPAGLNLTYDGKKQTKIKGVHKDVSSKLTKAFEELIAEYGTERLTSLKINFYSGYYNKRTKRGGTTWSMHSWGIAIDLYASKNWLDTKAPEALFSKAEYQKFIDIMENNGFYSLGRAKNYDYMHFQAWDPGVKESDGTASGDKRLAGRPYSAASVSGGS